MGDGRPTQTQFWVCFREALKAFACCSSLSYRCAVLRCRLFPTCTLPRTSPSLAPPGQLLYMKVLICTSSWPFGHRSCRVALPWSARPRITKTDRYAGSSGISATVGLASVVLEDVTPVSSRRYFLLASMVRTDVHPTSNCNLRVLPQQLDVGYCSKTLESYSLREHSAFAIFFTS